MSAVMFAFPSINATALTVEEFDKFRQKLEHHDWFHGMSDDSTAWRRGFNERAALEKQLGVDPLIDAMFESYERAHFNERSGFSQFGPGPAFDELNDWLDGNRAFHFGESA